MERDAAGTKGERFDDAIGQAVSGERLLESRHEGKNRPRSMALPADCGIPEGVWMARLGRHRQAVQEARKAGPRRHLSSVTEDLRFARAVYQENPDCRLDVLVAEGSEAAKALADARMAVQRQPTGLYPQERYALERRRVTRKVTRKMTLPRPL